VNHYITGGGAVLDVSKYQRILDIARAQKMKAIEDEKVEILKEFLRKADCPGSDEGGMKGPYKKFLKGEGFRAINYLGSIPALGSANMYIEYDCEAQYTCFCCPTGAHKGWIPNVGKWKCEFKYHFWDQFRDAADWFNRTGDDDEYIGGTRYDTIGSWKVDRSEIVHLGDCTDGKIYK